MAKAVFDRETILVRPANNRDFAQDIREGKVGSTQSIRPGEALDLTYSTTDPEGTPPTAVATVADEKANGFALAIEKLLVQPDAGTDAVDTPYTDNEYIRFFLPRTGDLVPVRISESSNVALGDILATNGSTGNPGTFVVITPDATTVAGTILLRAHQAITGAASVEPLCWAEVL